MSIKLVNGVFLSLAVVAAGLRFWVRFVILQSGGLDDMLLFFAVLVTICLSSASIASECLGLRNQKWHLNLQDSSGVAPIPRSITRALYVCYLAYPTALSLTKFSIMATYFRIFPPGYLRKITAITALTVSLYLVVSIFAILFTCIPGQAHWNYCLNAQHYSMKDFFTLSSSFDSLINIVLCALPIPILWSLGIPKAQRLILLLLFSGGILACIPSILRLTKLELDNRNLILYIVNAVKFFIIEVDTGIIFISVAALRPLFRNINFTCNSHGITKSSANIDQMSPSSEAKILDSAGATTPNYYSQMQPFSSLQQNTTGTEDRNFETPQRISDNLPSAPSFPSVASLARSRNHPKPRNFSLCVVPSRPNSYIDDTINDHKPAKYPVLWRTQSLYVTWPEDPANFNYIENLGQNQSETDPLDHRFCPRPNHY